MLYGGLQGSTNPPGKLPGLARGKTWSSKMADFKGFSRAGACDSSAQKHERECERTSETASEMPLRRPLQIGSM